MTDDVSSPTAPDLLAQASEPGKERELRYVQPGWWIHVFDGVDGEVARATFRTASTSGPSSPSTARPWASCPAATGSA